MCPSFLVGDLKWETPFMPRSNQILCPVLAMKLLRIMLKTRCWPTTCHIITTKDVNGMVSKLAGTINSSK